MDGLLIIHIDAAVVMPELIRVDDDTWRFPEPNPEYQWLTMIDGVTLASKDEKEWVVTCGVIIDGETLSPKHVWESLMEYLRRRKNDGSKQGYCKDLCE